MSRRYDRNLRNTTSDRIRNRSIPTTSTDIEYFERKLEISKQFKYLIYDKRHHASLHIVPGRK